MKEQFETQTDDAQKGVLIPFSDDVDETASVERDEDPDEPGISPDVKKERNKRRGERIGQRLRAGEEAQQKVGTLEQQNRELAERLARLEGAHVQLASQGINQTQRPDVYEAKLQEIERRRDLELRTADQEIKDGKWNPDRAAHYKKLGDELDQQRIDTLVERRMAQQQPQVQAAVQTSVAQNMWQTQYPEMYEPANQRALAWASARNTQLIAEGKPATVDTIHEAMRESRQKFKIGPQTPPREVSRSEQSRFSGHPATGTSNTAGPKPQGGIVMTRELQRIARAAHPNLKPEEADKKWAQTTGKKMRERGEL